MSLTELKVSEPSQKQPSTHSMVFNPKTVRLHIQKSCNALHARHNDMVCIQTQLFRVHENVRTSTKKRMCCIPAKQDKFQATDQSQTTQGLRLHNMC